MLDKKSFSARDLPRTGYSTDGTVNIPLSDLSREPTLVEHDEGDDVHDPEDPFNWSSSRKIAITIIVSVGQLVTLMSTSMMAAAMGHISHDLGISESTTQIAFSIFLLGLGVGPLVIAAFSEMYGRKPVWLVSNAIYILFNSLCPVGNSAALMIFGRFMAGAGASVGVALNGPMMGDIYRKEERGKSLAIAALLPFLGPALGPLVGGIMTQKVGWPWLFWVLSIFCALIWTIGLIFMRETWAPVLLARKRRAAAAALGMPPPKPLSFKEVSSQLAVHLRRPFKLFWQRPVVQVISIIPAIGFAIYFLMLSTFATLWRTQYGYSELISSLHYIAVSIGASLGTQIGGRLMDWVFACLKARSKDGSTRPEFRVPCLVPGVILMPAGLFWYGWAAENNAHWAVVDVGVAVFACGTFLITQVMLAYTLDEFTYAASAQAVSKLLGNVLAFIFPIFAPQLFARLGYGWGNSVLAFVTIALVWPLSALLWVWGAKLRAIGR